MILLLLVIETEIQNSCSLPVGIGLTETRHPNPSYYAMSPKYRSEINSNKTVLQRTSIFNQYFQDELLR